MKSLRNERLVSKDRKAQNTPQPQRYRNRKYARKLDAACAAIARGQLAPVRTTNRRRIA